MTNQLISMEGLDDWMPIEWFRRDKVTGNFVSDDPHVATNANATAFMLQIETLLAQQAKSNKRINELKAALRFYENRKGYDNSGLSKWFPLCEDEGAVARAALNQGGDVK